MIGLRTQRSSAPTEGLEDVSAFPGPSKITSARETDADKGDVSGTEERRNVDAREDKGVCTAPQGLQCAKKRTELESEVLLRMDSRNEGSGDVLTFSGPSETILVKEITSDMFRADEADCSKNVGESERVENVDVSSLLVSNKGTGAATAASGLSETIPGKEIDADSSDVFRIDEICCVENAREGDRVHTDPLTVSDEDLEDFTTSSGLSKSRQAKVNVSTNLGVSTMTGHTKIDNAPFLTKLVPLLLDNAILCSAITAPGCEEGVAEHSEDVRAYIEQAAKFFSASHEEKKEWITITPRGSGGDSAQGTPRGLSREEESLKNNAGSASNSFAALCEGDTMEDGSDFYSEIDLEWVRSLRGQQVKTKKKAHSSTKKVDANSRDVFSIDEKYCVVNFGEGVTTSSGFSETILEKKINTDSSDASHTDEIYGSDNAGKSERVKHVGVYPITVSNEGMEVVTTSFGLSEIILVEQISADGSEHFNTCLQNFGNNAEPKTKMRYKTLSKKGRSLFKQQLHTSRWVYMALILLSLLGHVNADAPASSHGWDFRNCVTGQNVLDTGEDGGKTASPINGPTCSAIGISLDGNDDYVNINESWEWGGATSFEVYVKYDSFNSYSYVFHFANGHQSNNVFLRNEGTSTIRWNIYEGGMSKSLSTSNFDSSTWTHLVATISGTTMKLYKNGALTGTKTDGLEPNVLTRTFHNIGGQYNQGGSLDGTIAYIKMWHGVELQQSDVTSLYSPHNTAHYFWDFRGCNTGGTVTDSIAGDLVATPMNGPVCGADGLSLDGSDDYADIDDWEWGGTTSFEVYVKYDSFNSYSQVFNFGNGDSSDNVYLHNQGSTSTIEWSVYQGSTGKTLTTSNFDSSTWTHVVVTVSGTTMKTVYKNGFLVGSKTDGHEPNVLTRADHIIGSTNSGGMNYFMDGTIAYVKMWHGVELQQSDVTSLYAPHNTAHHFWDFRGCNTGGTVTDSIAGDLVATPMNGPVCGADGLSLDGSDDYADIDDWEWGGTTSFEMYVKYDSFNSHSRIFDFGNAGYDENVLLKNLETSDIRFYILDGVGEGLASSNARGLGSGNFESATWTHVVVTVSGNTMKVYKNGILAGTNTDGWEPNVLTRTNHIIGARNTMANYMDGTIAYVKMWHGVELQQSDVTNLYAPHNTAHHFWSFLGCDSESSITDSTAGDLVATPMNGASCSAEGMVMDGVDNYVDIGDWEWGGTTSFEVYVKYDSFSKDSRIFDFGSGANRDNVILRSWGTTSEMDWSVRQESTFKGFHTNNFDSSTWTHVVATVSGTTMKIYKNGVLAGSKTDGWEPNVLTRTQHWLGRSAWSSDGYFDGTIAYLKIWHGVELSQDDVSSLPSVPCGPGTYGTSFPDCSICPHGSFNPSVGATSCQTCGVGTYNPDDGTSHALHDSASDCLICPAGKFNADEGSDASLHSSCNVCTAGKYNTDPGTAASAHVQCLSCRAGKYLEDDGTTATAHDESRDCHKCSAGKYSSIAGSTTCNECDGDEVSAPGATECSTCVPGFVCDGGSVTPCVPGTYSRDDSDCLHCDEGHMCPGSSDKVECQAGTYQPNKQQQECLPCSAGKYQPDTQSSGCLECPVGHFCPRGSVSPLQCGNIALFCPAGSTTVNPAQDGYYTLNEDGELESELTRASEQLCPLGHACSGGSLTPCLKDETFQNNEGHSNCQQCAVCSPGTYELSPCTTTEDRVCQSCDAGSASSGGLVKNCELCDSLTGEFSSGLGNSACMRVPPGAMPFKNASGFSYCPPGTASPAGENCTSCSNPGEFSPGWGNNVCLRTPAGSMPFVNRSGYTLCRPGTSSLSGLDCMLCEAGKFSSEPGSELCTSCPNNQDSVPGSTSCSCKNGFEETISDGVLVCECPRGFTLSDGLCRVCPQGKFKEDRGNQACLSCDQKALSGSSSTRHSIMNESEAHAFPPISRHNCTCEVGFFHRPLALESDSTDTGMKVGTCEYCPDGTNCTDPGITLETLPLVSGYWRSGFDSEKIEKCYTPKACTQANVTVEPGKETTQCAEGHEGPICNVCADMYAKSVTGQCE
ncbi:hypothetical protein TL16_g04526 [Triparma laevis f. inornata]|uniref:TNFR-Cys domain-containing protein n=1 Tax=Triparma laevis f. inornata TaxID=1714386 RepID=A0A9W7AED5_9STRA|nr:hypothetical protein TL16_g04526 [Triparma laevis f. inornata]